MRYRKYIAQSVWVLIGLMSVLFFNALRSINEQTEEVVIELDVSALHDELATEAATLLEQYAAVEFNSSEADELFRLKKERWYYLRSSEGEKQFWNSNKFWGDSSLLEKKKPTYYWYGDDFYLSFSDGKQLLAHRLVNGDKPSQRMLKAYPQLKNFVFHPEQNKLKLKEGDSSLYFISSNSKRNYSWTFFTLLLSLLVLQFFIQLSADRWRVATVLALTALFLDVLMQAVYGVYTDFAAKLYHSELYASSDILSSLGALINHSLVFLPLLFLLRRALAGQTKSWWLHALLFAFALFMSDLLIGVGRGLVRDSSISFDFGALYGIDLYTFVALSLVGLMLYYLSVLIITSKLFTGQWVMASVLGLILFMAFQIIDGHRSFVSLLLPVAVVVVIGWIDQLVVSRRLKASLLYFTVVIISSFVVLRAQLQRETQHVMDFASSLLSEQDLRAEYILKSFEDRLAEEFLVPEDYTDFKLRKDAVERRIKQLYFSNYLEKYELRLISFDSAGHNINDNDLYDYDQLDTIYNLNTKRTVSNYFYQITSSSLVNSYLAKYENCDIHGHYGTTYILLQPRLIESDYLYPEAFANQQTEHLIDLNAYAYAIYYHGVLINQKGSYNYSLHELPQTSSHPLLYQFGGVYHFYHKSKDDFEIILSKEFNVLYSWLSTFTFNFFFVMPLALLIFILSYFYEPSSSVILDLKGRFLSTRIQMSLTVLLLMGLLMSVYIMINYIRSNYTTNLETQLVGTIKNIGSQFQNTVDLQDKLEHEEERQLILNEQSGAFKVDLNLYGQSGTLLSTTKPYLINEEVVGPVMNPLAYSKLKGNNFSQLLVQEELEGTEYLSAYVPLFNAKSEVIAYLNIPYFAKNQELDQQISSFIVSVINIYFLLLLGGVLLALFISKQIAKPLHLIRDRIAETNFGVKNELIVYNRDDEIGQLVKQYNRMVVALEESARKLAETEREGAWREMAKQVAHEIKNPLTPMKLSIQHLQRAYAQGGERVDELFKRTSKLLIEQIDSLSRMASEFSAFAKMPQDFYEVFDLSSALESTIELFGKDDQVRFVNTIQKEVYVNADPEQIRRVFNNIIKNGIQSVPEGRQAEIRSELRTEGQWAIVTIKDNGRGIDKDIQAHVFEPNFSTKTSGMGLGLAICKKIIETADGQIDFSTTKDKGTTFTIKLPIYHEE